jgi:flagellar assembly protein FliH
VNGEDKKLIDSNEKSEQFRIIHFERKIQEMQSEEVASTESDDIDFTEGLKVQVVETISQEEKQLFLTEQSEAIISEAMSRANDIISSAEQEARQRCEQIFEEAKRQGYEEGLQNGYVEIESTKRELAELAKKHEIMYQEQIGELEPHFAHIVAALVENLVGVVVEDKKDIIQYLIHNAITNADSSKTFNIRVSKEDYDLAYAKKDELVKLVNEGVIVDVTLDKELNKNQCFIETDTSIIDCSLDIQLNNLVQDIKLLSGKNRG